MNTLFCTLGGSAAVVSETLIAIENKYKVKIDNVVIIHTDDKRVLSKINNKGINIGLLGLIKELKKRKIKVTSHSLGFTDIFSKKENEITFNSILSYLYKYRQKSEKLFCGIAGGRKTMSAYLLLASYLVGCDGVFHVILNTDEKVIENNYGLLDIPSKYITLIKIPHINLDHTFLLALEELNESKEDFISSITGEENKKEAFERLNKILRDNINIRSLKKLYEKDFNKYDKMCNVVANILLKYSSNTKILNPDLEKRVKSFESIVEKIPRKGLERNFNNESSLFFNDIAGVRLICYFKEDYNKICKEIERKVDFNIRKAETKRDEFGYRATHYDITLKRNRTKLLEYSDLKDIICEIQIKTVFAHAWSKVHHKLIYKSEEFKNISDSKKDIINKTFNSSARFLEGAENEFSRIRKFYNQ